MMYRNGYIAKFNVDLSNTVITVGSLSMYIYINFFNNSNTIASNTDKRAVSISARQWLTDIRNNNEGVSLFEEFGLKIKFDVKTYILSTELFGNKDIAVNIHKSSISTIFSNKPNLWKLIVLLLMIKTHTLFQFYDDYSFGHPNFKYSNSDQIDAGRVRYSKLFKETY